MALKESPSQTAGPYVHIGCDPCAAGLERRNMGAQLGINRAAKTDHDMTLALSILDGGSEPIKDALVEIWHAGPDGNYQSSNWVRRMTDFETGIACFDTVKPAASDGQSPHILIWIAARGINLGLTTRLYFPDEVNDADPVFGLAKERASTMIAMKTDDGYAHTIRLQGPKETVFFDV